MTAYQGYLQVDTADDPTKVGKYFQIISDAAIYLEDTGVGNEVTYDSASGHLQMTGNANEYVVLHDNTANDPSYLAIDNTDKGFVNLQCTVSPPTLEVKCSDGYVHQDFYATTSEGSVFLGSPFHTTCQGAPCSRIYARIVADPNL